MKEKQDEFDALRSELVANEAETSAQKRLIGLQEQTHKTETDRRVAEAHLNEVQSERYQKSQDEIADAKAQLALATEQAQTAQNLLNTRKEIRKVKAERRVLQEQLSSTPGQVNDDDMETLVAFEDRVLRTQQEMAKEEKERDEFINALYQTAQQDSELVDKLNAWGSDNIEEYQPYENMEALMAARGDLISNFGYEKLKEFRDWYNGAE